MCVNKNAEYDVIAKEIDALREKKAAVVTNDAEQEMLRKRINEMRHFLQTQTSRITEYDEQLVRNDQPILFHHQKGSRSGMEKKYHTSTLPYLSGCLHIQGFP